MKPEVKAIMQNQALSRIPALSGLKFLNTKFFMLRGLQSPIFDLVSPVVRHVKQDMYINSFPDRMDISN
jgi:hypothetical protein